MFIPWEPSTILCSGHSEEIWNIRCRGNKTRLPRSTWLYVKIVKTLEGDTEFYSAFYKKNIIYLGVAPICLKYNTYWEMHSAGSGKHVFSSAVWIALAYATITFADLLGDTSGHPHFVPGQRILHFLPPDKSKSPDAVFRSILSVRELRALLPISPPSPPGFLAPCANPLWWKGVHGHRLQSCGSLG